MSSDFSIVLEQNTICLQNIGDTAPSVPLRCPPLPGGIRKGEANYDGDGNDENNDAIDAYSDDDFHA